MQPAIFGISGERLSEAERAFFRDADPAGYILFKRNCADREQLKALTDELRAIHGREGLPILIDQEGGRVARMRAPVWPEFPSAGRFAELYQVSPISGIEAARVNAAAIAAAATSPGRPQIAFMSMSSVISSPSKPIRSRMMPCTTRGDSVPGRSSSQAV